MGLFKRVPNIIASFGPSHLPPDLERKYKQSRSRQWWWRDIAGYLVFITALSLLYVLVACCLDAQAATAAVAHSSSRPTTSCSTSSFVPRLPYHSEAYDAPSADAYSKLQLVPSYATARQAAAVAAPAGDCMAPAQCSNTEQPTLRQLLYNKAAAAVAGLDDHRSSLGMSMLRQPKLLLRQAPLLFLWRLWFMADMFLVAKLGMAFLFLMIALVNPGFYRLEWVRTALIATYILAPLALLPARLLTCSHSSSVSSSPLAAPAPPGASLAAPHPAGSPATITFSALQPEQLPPWPSGYFSHCPVPPSAEAFQALLSYASVVVMLDTLLHPLPLLWQAVVNAASWLCLAGCGVLIKAHAAPAAAAGLDSAAGSAGAAGVGLGHSSRMDVAVFLGEVFAGFFDGLLLAGMLPLALTAWTHQRSRKQFSKAFNPAPEAAAALRALEQQQQQLGTAQQQAVGTAGSQTGVQSSGPFGSFVLATVGTERSTVQAAAANSVSRLTASSGVLSQAAASAAAGLRCLLRLYNRPGTIHPATGGAAAAPYAAAAGNNAAAAAGVHVRSNSASSLAPATPSGSSTFGVFGAEQQADKSNNLHVGTARQREPVTVQQQQQATNSAAATAGMVATPRSSIESTASSRSVNIIRYKPGTGSNSGSGSSNASPSSSSQSGQPSAASATSRRPVTAAAPHGGAVGPVSGLGMAQTAVSPPGSPAHALYESPLETVIISFKLSSAAPRAPRAAAGGATAVAVGSRTMAAPTPGGPTSVDDQQRQQQHHHPQPLAASGASRQLRADIEVAVRQVVAQSQLQILTTSVSSFPGCVHVVMAVNLATLQGLQRMAAAEAMAAAADNKVVADAVVHIEDGEGNAVSSGSNASSVGIGLGGGVNGAVMERRSLASLVDWQQVVQQLQQCMLPAAEEEQEGALHSSPLELRYMLVQDGSGEHTHWFWQAPDAAVQPTGAAAAAAPGYIDAADVGALVVSTALGGSAGPARPQDAPGAGAETSSRSQMGRLSMNETASSGSDAHNVTDGSACVECDESASLHIVSRSVGTLDSTVSFRQPVLLPAATAGAVGDAGRAQVVSARSAAASIFARPPMARLLTAAEMRAPAALLSGAHAQAIWPGDLAPSSLRAAVGVGLSAAPDSGAAEPFRSSAGWTTAAAAAPAAAVVVPSPASSSGSSSTPGRSPRASTDSQVSSSTAALVVPGNAPSALSLISALHADCHNITLSSFAVPSDQGGLDQATQPGYSRLVTQLMPVLRLPDSLAASLSAQNAGLRIVITEAAHGSAAGSVSGVSGPWEGLTGWSWNDDQAGNGSRQMGRSHSTAGEFGERDRSAASGSSAAGTPGDAAILTDATFWPEGDGSRGGSSSGDSGWPVNNKFALRELLPPGVDGEWLARTHGPVLALNMLATPAKQTAAAAAPAPAAAGRLVSECLLLQLPLLVVPGAVCEGLAELAHRMATEAGSFAAAYHGHLLPLVRDIAVVLLERQAVQRAAAAQQSGAALGLAGMARLQLCSAVLGFLASQGLQECAAALQEQLEVGVGDVAWPAPAASELASAVLPAAASGGAAGVAGAQAANEIGAVPAADNADAESTNYTPSTAAPAQAAEGVAAGEPVAAAAQGDEGNMLPTQHPAVHKAIKQAAAARDEAQAARQAAAEASAALAVAVQSLNTLCANAAAAAQQAQRAETTAAAAVRRAEAIEVWAQRQRALQLIGGGHVESGPLGAGVWGVLGAASGLREGGRSADAEMLSGPPQLPQHVSWRDVLLGFRDARLEVQYRRLKAMHVACIDKAALVLHAVREATVVWRLGRLLAQQAAGGSQLSLVLLCKYEAVTVLPYVMSLVCPDFWIQHRNFMLMLSQVACGLTMGMITATEVYRNEWSQLLGSELTSRTSSPLGKAFTPGAAAGGGLLARPAMLLVWFYVVVPLLQQLCVPEQLLGGCVSQAVQTLLAYRFIFKGSMALPWLLLWLLAGAAVSFGIAYAADSFMRRQAVASARRTLQRGAHVAQRAHGHR